MRTAEGGAVRMPGTGTSAGESADASSDLVAVSGGSEGARQAGGKGGGEIGAWRRRRLKAKGVTSS